MATPKLPLPFPQKPTPVKNKKAKNKTKTKAKPPMRTPLGNGFKPPKPMNPTVGGPPPMLGM